ncbi:MAG: AbrB/MazE/SpoVT family DNA-binding domain-containing protein [Candidatus Acidiferrales bacterium]
MTREKVAVAVVTVKGQVVIPSKFRRKYGIRKGTQVAVVDEGSKLVLQPLTPEFVRSLRGMLKRKPSPLEYLLEERKREREL